MKKKIFCLITLSILLSSSLSAESPENTLLPNPFQVYIDNIGHVQAFAAPGFTEKNLPTINEYLENPGCYIACYSHSSQLGIYPVTNDIFVVGQIRLSGKYQGSICLPKGHEKSDISADLKFKELCSQKFNCKDNSCWAGGETGKWFGLK